MKPAMQLLQANKELKSWYEIILKTHSSLTKNTDYAFTGLLYQLLQFEPFKSYIGVSIGSGVIDERAARNISILSSVLTLHIELYENCSLQYKFFKELGFTQVRVGATLFGTLVHETIEDIHRAAMRHEEDTITPENVRQWLDTNYSTLSKSEHAYLGAQQIDSAYDQVQAYVDRMNSGIGLIPGGEGNESLWSHIQDAEVDVSYVKPEYILQGTVDLIRGDGDSVEIVDFKSEKKPDMEAKSESFERYRRQLEVYAYLIEERLGKKVSRMHLYYTGEDKGEPIVTFEKSKESIDSTRTTT